MLVNNIHNDGTAALYSLVQQGYKIHDVWNYTAPVRVYMGDINRSMLTLVAPNGTYCRIKLSQFVSFNGKFVDTFEVVSVVLPSGEICRGEKFMHQRWVMLAKRAEKLNNACYFECQKAEEVDANARLKAAGVTELY